MSDAEPIFGRHCCRLWVMFIAALFFAGTQVSGQQISARPMAFGIYRSDGGTWAADKRPISLLGWGVDAAGKYGAWSVSAQIVYMRFFAQAAPYSQPAPV